MLLAVSVVLVSLTSSCAARDAASWDACQMTVCNMVAGEADGLARVKLLRGYVTETVKLLDSLMVSLDHELVDIATGIKDFVGPRCTEAHTALAQVAKPLNDGDLELSAGIMEESTAQALERDDLNIENLSNGVQTSESNKKERHSKTTDNQYASSSQNREQLSSSVSPHRSSSGTGRQLSQSTFSDRRGGTATTSWGIEEADTDSYGSHSANVNTHRSENQPRSSEGNNRNRFDNSFERPSKGRQQQHRSDNRGRSTTTAASSTQYYNGGSNNNRPGSSLGATSWAPVPTGPTCKGLSGSPFAVPGIDTWCIQNCARGYCPATHCLCS